MPAKAPLARAGGKGVTLVEPVVALGAVAAGGDASGAARRVGPVPQATKLATKLAVRSAQSNR